MGTHTHECYAGGLTGVTTYLVPKKELKTAARKAVKQWFGIATSTG
jgi:hypothetical protein